MKFATSLLAAVTATLVFAGAASAHFIWVYADSSGKAPTATVAFSEGPKQDSAEFLDKIARAKLDWAGKTTSRLKLERHVEGDDGSLRAPLPEGEGVLELTCRYGVLEKGGSKFLLEYYAKSLDLLPPSDWSEKGKSKALALDVVPALGDAAGDLKITVLWQGKPVADGEVTLIDSKEEEHKAKTDSKGTANWSKLPAGRVGIRAKYSEADREGTHEGQAFQGARHYSTLTLQMPEAK
jgi:uncharacterized GH25 family protein